MDTEHGSPECTHMLTAMAGEGATMQSLEEVPDPKMMILKRRLYTADELNDAYPLKTEECSLRRFFRSQCFCSTSRCRDIVLGYFPIIDVLRNYKWRADILADFMAGISVAFMHLPQGLALSILASLPPVYGLYTTLFSVLVYTIFGTARHMSIGTNALTALMTASIIAKELQAHTNSLSSSNSFPTAATPSRVVLSPNEEISFKVGIAAAVAFMAGLFMSVAGLLKFGFVTSYLSSSFVGGFTTAASFHILTSQISKLLHIKVKLYSGAGKIVKTYIDIFQNIENSNPADVVISVISIIFLLIVTIYINERFKAKLKVPVPVQLILVIISTFVSHFADLHSRFDVAIVGDIPTGFPPPKMPDMDSIPRIASDSFVVAVLTFTISISLVKLTAKIHNYSVDDNQELLAYGLSNFISSFFSCFTSCNAPPRAMILSNVGAKSTFNSVFCAVFILITILVAGPLFRALPVAVLAAMICVAMKNLLLQVTQLPFLWRTNKPDFIIWLSTCLVSIFVDLDIGIITGIGISILTIIIRSQIVPSTLGAVSVTEDLIHLNANRGGLKVSDSFIIFYFPSQLYFATAEKFKKDILSKIKIPDSSPNGENTKDTALKYDSVSKGETKQKTLKYIILECSAMTYMDITGASMMKTVAGLYKETGLTILLVNCPDYSLNVLEKMQYFKDIPKNTVYHDVYDAVNFIQENYSSNSDGSLIHTL